MSFDLNQSDVKVLRALCHCTTPISQNALASRTGLSVNTVKASAARIARGRVVERRERRNRVELTIGDGELASFYRAVFQQEALLFAQRRRSSRDLGEVLEATEDLNHFIEAARAKNR